MGKRKVSLLQKGRAPRRWRELGGEEEKEMKKELRLAVYMDQLPTRSVTIMYCEHILKSEPRKVTVSH